MSKTTDVFDLPAIGHNNPPEPTLAEMLNASRLLPDLTQRFAKLVARKAELLAGVERFKAANPTGILDDEVQQKATDLQALLGKFCGDSGFVEKAREEEKKPVLAAGKTIDGFFKGLRTPVQEAMATVVKMTTAYAVKQAHIKQAAAAAEAKRLADLAAEAEAAAAKNVAHFDAAIQTAELAEIAAAKASGSAATFTRTAGDFSTGSLTTTWDCEVTDIVLIDRRFLVFDKSAALRAIRGDEKLRNSPGLRIFESQSYRARA